jgi:hypothetical protein
MVDAVAFLLELDRDASDPVEGTSSVDFVTAPFEPKPFEPKPFEPKFLLRGRFGLVGW